MSPTHEEPMGVSAKMEQVSANEPHARGANGLGARYPAPAGQGE